MSEGDGAGRAAARVRTQLGVHPFARAVGLYDVVDPRGAFCRQAAPASLYIPDKHLSVAGNLLLLGEIVSHLQESSALISSAGGAFRR